MLLTVILNIFVCLFVYSTCHKFLKKQFLAIVIVKKKDGEVIRINATYFYILFSDFKKIMTL